MRRQLDPKQHDGDRWPLGHDLAEVVPLVAGEADGARPAPGQGVPSYLSSFIGRERETRELVAVLRSARLVTLTGGGGMGKTRLAVEVAEAVAPGRAIFVDLSSVREAALVEEEVASAFGLCELRGRSLAAALAPELTPDALLVLDNCEHLVQACSQLLHLLLRGCRNLRVLATSQHRLGVPGEVVWSVPPLGLPSAGPAAAPAHDLDSPAVQLFFERARAVNQRFSPSSTDVEAIVEICRRLDGNPLAIELAAARVDVLSPGQIADRLEGRFEILRGRAGAGSARHQTLTAALKWSDELLEERERALLRRLSVFAGGFSLEAAETVCAGDEVDRHQVLDSLSALVAKSLVVAETGGRAARFRLLETVRSYASGRLAGADAAQLRERHARWCLQVVEPAPGTDDKDRIEAMELEQDNVRAALEWCLAERRVEQALRLAIGQMEYWEGSGRFTEAREWLERIFVAGGPAPVALWAAARHNAGFASLVLGDFGTARGHLRQSLSLWSEAGDEAAAGRTQGLLAFVSTFGDGPVSVDQLECDVDEVRATGDDDRLAEALVACGHARLFRGDPVAAQRHFEELVMVTRRSKDEALLVTGLVGLGSSALARADFSIAEAHLDEGVALGSGPATAHTRLVGMAGLAELARLRGHHDEARSLFEQCLDPARRLGAPYPLAKALLGLAQVALDRDDVGGARSFFDEAAALARHAGLSHLLAAALNGLGNVATATDDADSARDRCEEALAVARGCGDRVAAARATYDLAVLARARGDLTEAVSLHHEALQERQETDDRAGVADSLEAIAALLAVAGSDEAASRLFGAGEALRHALGCPRPRRQIERYEADVALLCDRMEAEDLHRTWRQGGALSYDEAVAYASKRRGPRDRPATGLASLTPTERDVAALATEGLTNREIAERLFISPRTVQTHLRNMYTKLHVGSRSELRQAVSGERGPA